MLKKCFSILFEVQSFLMQFWFLFIYEWVIILIETSSHLDASTVKRGVSCCDVGELKCTELQICVDVPAHPATLLETRSCLNEGSVGSTVCFSHFILFCYELVILVETSACPLVCLAKSSVSICDVGKLKW